MVSCAVPLCRNNDKNTKRSKISFHEFPCNLELRNMWRLAVGRIDSRTGGYWVPSGCSVVCSVHFRSEDFVPTTKIKRLKRNVVPSIFPGYPDYMLKQNSVITRNSSPQKSKSKRKHIVKQPVDKTVEKVMEQQVHKESSEDEETVGDMPMKDVPSITESNSYSDFDDISSTQMSRNVEIKARIQNIISFLTTAKNTADKIVAAMQQEDTYFKVPRGRLKLRQIAGQPSQLVFYDRPDTEGPKLSNYSIQQFQDDTEAQGLKNVLSASLGVLGVIKKERHLFTVGQTRIHVDDVEQLGHFMELEVALNEEQSIEDGQLIAQQLMSALNINSDDLLPGSYIDLLKKTYP